MNASKFGIRFKEGGNEIGSAKLGEKSWRLSLSHCVMSRPYEVSMYRYALFVSAPICEV